MGRSDHPEEPEITNPPNKPGQDPFINFRRYADEQVGALLNTVTRLPTAIYERGNERGQKLQSKIKERDDSRVGVRNGEYPGAGDGKAVNEADHATEDRRIAQNDPIRETEERAREQLQHAREAAVKIFDGLRDHRARWKEEWEKERNTNTTRDTHGRSHDGSARSGQSTRCQEPSSQEMSKQEQTWSDWFWGTPQMDSPKDSQAVSTESSKSVGPPRSRHSSSWPSHPISESTADDYPPFPFGDFLSLPGLVFSSLSQNNRILPYLFLNPYSPLHLERHPELGQFGTQWRAAFEDLMRVGQDEQLMDSATESDIEKSNGFEWAANLAVKMGRNDFSPVPWQRGAEGLLSSAGSDETEFDDWPFPHTAMPFHPGKIVRALLAEIAGDEHEEATRSREGVRRSHDDEGQGWDEFVKRVFAARDEASESQSRRSPARQGHDNQTGYYVASGPTHDDDDEADNDEADDEHGYEQDNGPHSEEDEEAETELDAYDHLVCPYGYTASPSVPASASPSPSQSLPAPSKPSVLSTLTTTERRVRPDGTVTTRVVLKKRFADGSEESSETVHTTQAGGRAGGPPAPSSETGETRRLSDAAAPAAAAAAAAEKPSEGREGGSGKKRGWFWSD